MGVPCFVSLQDFYRNRRADLAVLSSPIQVHMPQTAFALAKGSHVLCEKPAAGTIQDVRAAIEAEKASARWVAVGYQWSFSSAVQDLKDDIRSGLFGAAKRFKCLYLWPRDEGYYARNDWAGKRRDAEGAWVLDSPVQNAMAHDLHNMFYVLGKDKETSARPGRGRGRALPGQRHREFRHRGGARPDGGGRRAPVLRESRLGRGQGSGRRATNSRRPSSGATAGRRACGPSSRTGRARTTACRTHEPMNKLWQSIAGVREGGARPLCGLEAAASQTLCMNGIQDSMPDIRDFPAGLVRVVEGPGGRRGRRARALVVEGLDAALAACYESERLPSEMGVPWSAKGTKIDLREYHSFPSR